MALSNRHFFLASGDGAMTALRAYAALPEERRAAVARGAARRIVEELVRRADSGHRSSLLALAALAAGPMAPLERASIEDLRARILGAVDDGKLMLVHGWRRETVARTPPPPQKPID